MTVLAPQEPVGYRGRRRLRLSLTRRGGGVVIPALLLAASVVVVLIVVGVEQLLPKETGGTIPYGGAPATISDDGGAASTPQVSTRPGGGSSPGRSRPPGAPAPSAGGSGPTRPATSSSPGVPVPPSPSPAGHYPGWQPGHAYVAGDRVTYAGNDYQCVQAHTSLTGWEPPNAPALWRVLS
jgi:hypothetical protein